MVKAGYRTYGPRASTFRKPKDKIDVALSILPPGKIIFSIEPYASVAINGRVVRMDVTYYEAELPPGTVYRPSSASEVRAL